MRIVLAEDQALIREGLVRVLAELDVVLVKTVDNGADAVRAALDEHADVVLMDVDMPVMDGIAAVRELQRERPSIKVLMLSAADSETTILSAIEAGASGYLLKSSVTITQLRQALETLAQGHAHFSPRIVSMMAKWLRERGGPRGPLDALSERQLQIFHALAAGQSVKQIAFDLGVSRSTVETHRTSLLAKLNLADNAALMRFAFEAGLIDTSKPPSTNP